MKPKVKPIKDKDFYDAYLLDHDRCEACYSKDTLSRHHIIRFGRSDEWSVVILVCQRCHDLADGRNVRSQDTGELYPRIEIGVFLTLKLLSVPPEGSLDVERLQELYGQRLPDFEPLPEWMLEERRRNAPRKKP